MGSILSVLPRALLVATVLMQGVGCVSAGVVSTQRTEQAQAMVDRGAAFLQLGKLDEAAASFRVAAETAQIAGAYDGLACVEFLKGNSTEAKKLFRHTIEWFPTYNPARANYALVLDLEGKKAEAEQYYRSAIAADPMNYKIRNNYGILLRSQNLKRISSGFLTDAYVLSGHPLIKANRSTQE